MERIQLALCFREYTYVNSEFGTYVWLKYMCVQCYKTCNAMSSVDCSWKPSTHSFGHVFDIFNFKEPSQRK